MDARREGEAGEDRRIDVDQPPFGVIGHEVAATNLAPFAEAVVGPVMAADHLDALRQADGFARP